MLQQLTIRTANKAALRPILRSSIESEKRMISFGLQKTRQHLVDFERQFGISSADFERELNSGNWKRR